MRALFLFVCVVARGVAYRVSAKGSTAPLRLALVVRRGW